MTAPHQRWARSGDGLRILRAAVFAAVCVVLGVGGHTLASCATVPLWTLAAGFLGALAVALPLAGRTRSPAGIAALLALGQTALHTLFGLGQQIAASGTAPMASMTSMTAMARATASTASTAFTASAGGPSDAELVSRAARILCGTTAAAITPAHARRVLTDARLYDRTTGTFTGSGTGTAAPHHTADALPAVPVPGTASLTALLPSLPMLLCHVLAAIAAGWLLRRGDLALLRLIELSAHSVAEGGASVRSLRGALALARALYAGLPAAPEPGPRSPRTAWSRPPEPCTTALRHAVIRRGPPVTGALALAA
ncbi:hypothetical protein [Streptomyces sp. NPDC047000]|uniref:hypothetical protein n=1 Tax=Streptomyces sp. NPDC047000 TaxID=3155474 RepID=UPI0033EFC7E3